MGVHNEKLKLDHTICKFVSVIIFMYIKQHLLFLCALVLVLCSDSFVGLNCLVLSPAVIISSYYYRILLRFFLVGFTIIVSLNPTILWL